MLPQRRAPSTYRRRACMDDATPCRDNFVVRVIWKPSPIARTVIGAVANRNRGKKTTLLSLTHAIAFPEATPCTWTAEAPCEVQDEVARLGAELTLAAVLVTLAVAIGGAGSTQCASALDD